VGVFTADDPEGQVLRFQINDPSNNFIVSIPLYHYVINLIRVYLFGKLIYFGNLTGP